MALSVNFKEEYYKLLEECVLLVEKSERYEKICAEYTALKEKINKILEETDALCTDAERFLEKETGKIKPETEFFIGQNEELKVLLSALSALYIEKMSFASLGWTDDLMNHIAVVLASGKCQEKEEEIIAELGLQQGERVIYEEKKKVLKLEKELGVRFFEGDVERLEALFKVRVLFPFPEQTKMKAEENLIEENWILINADGECFQVEKYAQLRYKNALYVELIFPEEIKLKRKLNYYKVEKTKRGIRFVLVEDNELYEKLWAKVEKLEVRLQRR